MLKSIIMTTSAALVLMTAVTFSGQRGLDEFTIRVLGGTNATPQTAAPIVSSRNGTRGNSAGVGSSSSYIAGDLVSTQGLEYAMLVPGYEVPH